VDASEKQLELAAAEQAWRQLRRALTRAAVASSMVPSRSHSELLELIVSTAAHVLNASHGSLFLVDEPTQELVFEVALGEPIDEFKKLRLPLGHGIAGMVAVTGQAMAITDVADDPRHVHQCGEFLHDAELGTRVTFQPAAAGLRVTIEMTGDRLSPWFDRRAADAETIGDDSKWTTGLQLFSRRREYLEPPPRGVRQRLVQQARLADARFALDDDHPTPAHALLDMLVKRAHFLRATDQRPGRYGFHRQTSRVSS
jgi:hypothetical protein